MPTRSIRSANEKKDQVDWRDLIPGNNNNNQLNEQQENPISSIKQLSHDRLTSPKEPEEPEYQPKYMNDDEIPIVPDLLNDIYNQCIHDTHFKTDEAMFTLMQMLHHRILCESKHKGSEHPQVLKAIAELYLFYFGVQKYKHAERLLKRLQFAYQRTLTRPHIAIAESLMKLGQVSIHLDNYHQAIQVLFQSLHEYLSIYPKLSIPIYEYPHVLPSRNYKLIDLITIETSNPSFPSSPKALSTKVTSIPFHYDPNLRESYEMLFPIFEALADTYGKITITSSTNEGSTSLTNKQPKKSLRTSHNTTKITSITNKLNGKDTLPPLTTSVSTPNISSSTSSTTSTPLLYSQYYYELLLFYLIHYYSIQHVNTLQILNKLMLLLMSLQQYQEAEETINYIMDICVQTLGETHELTQQISIISARIKTYLQQTDEAEIMYYHAIQYTKRQMYQLSHEIQALHKSSQGHIVPTINVSSLNNHNNDVEDEKKQNQKKNSMEKEIDNSMLQDIHPMLQSSPTIVKGLLTSFQNTEDETTEELKEQQQKEVVEEEDQTKDPGTNLLSKLTKQKDLYYLLQYELAMIYETTQCYQKAIDILEKILPSIINYKSIRDPLVMDIQHHLGQLYIDLQQFLPARTYLLPCHASKQHVYHNNSLNTYKTLFLLIKTYYLESSYRNQPNYKTNIHETKHLLSELFDGLCQHYTIKETLTHEVALFYGRFLLEHDLFLLAKVVYQILFDYYTIDLLSGFVRHHFLPARPLTNSNHSSRLSTSSSNQSRFPPLNNNQSNKSMVLSSSWIASNQRNSANIIPLRNQMNLIAQPSSLQPYSTAGLPSNRSFPLVTALNNYYTNQDQQQQLSLTMNNTPISMFSNTLFSLSRVQTNSRPVSMHSTMQSTVDYQSLLQQTQPLSSMTNTFALGQTMAWGEYQSPSSFSSPNKPFSNNTTNSFSPYHTFQPISSPFQSISSGSLQNPLSSAFTPNSTTKNVINSSAEVDPSPAASPWIHPYYTNQHPTNSLIRNLSSSNLSLSRPSTAASTTTTSSYLSYEFDEEYFQNHSTINVFLQYQQKYASYKLFGEILYYYAVIHEQLREYIVALDTFENAVIVYEYLLDKCRNTIIYLSTIPSNISDNIQESIQNFQKEKDLLQELLDDTRNQVKYATYLYHIRNEE